MNTGRSQSRGSKTITGDQIDLCHTFSIHSTVVCALMYCKALHTRRCDTITTHLNTAVVPNFFWAELPNHNNNYNKKVFLLFCGPVANGLVVGDPCNTALIKTFKRIFATFKMQDNFSPFSLKWTNSIVFIVRLFGLRELDVSTRPTEQQQQKKRYYCPASGVLLTDCYGKWTTLLGLRGAFEMVLVKALRRTLEITEESHHSCQIA